MAGRSRLDDGAQGNPLDGDTQPFAAHARASNGEKSPKSEDFAPCPASVWMRHFQRSGLS